MVRGSDRLIARLSMATAVSLVLMVVATAGYIAWPQVAGAMGIAPAPRPPAYRVGDRVDTPADWHEGVPHTLMVFARASCGACAKAQPFLAELVAAMEGRGAAVMVHPAQTEAEDVAFAESLGIRRERTHVVPPGVRARVTPTILLVNRQGRIVGAWEGVGGDERQAEIRTTIEAAIR